ncbi:hypothetical protein BDK51DRAFT_53249, partial [Blyttiomyces helicus]
MPLIPPPLDGKLSPPPVFPDGTSYKILQTEEELTVTFVVPTAFKKELDIIWTAEQLTLFVGGEVEARVKVGVRLGGGVEGRLFAPIDEAVWQVESDPRLGLKIVTVHLDKRTPAHWPLLIKSGLSTPLPVPEDAALQDADPYSIHLLAEACLPFPRGAKRAARWFEAAAARGCVASHMKLAAWRREGLAEAGVEADAGMAFKHVVAAAEGGHHESAFMAALWYAEGSAPLERVDRVEAIRWCERTLEILDGQRGKETYPALYSVAAHHLGVFYAEGSGMLGVGNDAPTADSTSARPIPPDPTRAAAVWRVAASLGHTEAMYNLAQLLLNGFGGPQDCQLAISLIRTARQLDPAIAMPPQLAELDDSQLDILVVHEAETRKRENLPADKAIPIANLVEDTLRIVALAGGKEAVDA